MEKRCWGQIHDDDEDDNDSMTTTTMTTTTMTTGQHDWYSDFLAGVCVGGVTRGGDVMMGGTTMI